MRSSDTPANELDDELAAPQGPADWSREPRSDDLLLRGVLAKLAELDRYARHVELEPEAAPDRP